MTMNTTERLGKRGLSMSIWSAGYDSSSVSAKLRLSASFSFKAAFWVHLVTDLFRGEPDLQVNVWATMVILGLRSQSRALRKSGDVDRTEPEILGQFRIDMRDKNIKSCFVSKANC